MRLSEYSDDELIEEIKHRGLTIDIKPKLKVGYNYYGEQPKVVIGGVVFDLRT